MKRFFDILFVSGILLISGCQAKEEQFSGNGEDVVFGSSMVLNGPDTKTAFTGPLTGGINWSGGELIQIQALASGETTPRSGNYTVLQSGVDRSGISYNSGSVLKWRQSQYTFYGFYPAAIGSGFSYSNGAETLSNLSLPNTQNLQVDMSKLYLFARRQESQGNTVQLDFYPLVTTVGITVTNRKSANVTISEIRLTSDGKNPAGNYSVSFNGNAPLADNASGWPSISGGGVVSVNGSMSLGAKASQTTYLFLVPQVYDAGNVTLSFRCGDKTYEKTLGAILGVSSLLPAHKYHLGITISDEGAALEGLTLGGGQLMLVTLRNNAQKVLGLLKSYFGFEGFEMFWPNQNPEGFAIYKSIKDKISSNGDQFIKDHFLEADRVFNGGEYYSFTSEEMDILKDVVFGAITYTGTIGSEEYTKITADIQASDVAWFPNLQSINHLETNQNINPRPSLEVANMPYLQYVELNQYTYVTIKDCGGADGVSVKMSNANNTSGQLILQNLTISGQIDISNQHMYGPVLVDNVSGLNTLALGNGTDTHIKNCPDLQTITASTAHNLTSLTVEDCPYFSSFNINAANSNFTSINLKNTPYFVSGVSGDGHSNMTITLQNCSSSVDGNTTPYIQLNNTSLDNVNVNRDAASSRVEVRNNQGATK